MGVKEELNEACIERICLNMHPDNVIPVRNNEVEDFCHTVVEQMERNGRESGAVHRELKKQREPVYATSRRIMIEYPDENKMSKKRRAM